METSKKNKINYKIIFLIYSFILVSLMLNINLISAKSFGYDNLNEEGLITEINYSTINVNNSQYFQSYTPTTLKDWIKTQFDSVYCLLTGCSMSGDIDMNENNITAITKTSYINESYGIWSNSTDVVIGYIGGL